MPPKLNIKYNPSESQPKYDDDFTLEMVGCRTDNIYLIKQIFTFISNIMTEVNIRFCEDGIRITSMDSSHISLIDCFIPTCLFSTYNYKSELVCGIALKPFVQILNHMASDDEYIMIFNDDTIELIFVNDNHKKYYALKLIDIEQEMLNVHDLKDMTYIKFDSRYFNTIVKQLKDIGSNVRIKILKNKDKISFKTSGEHSDLKMIINNNDITVEHTEDISSEFAIPNIEEFSKGYNISSSIELKIGQDVPLEMKYVFLEKGYVKYFIAPKIDE